jgi:LmbE family N-acetylglucosaminyl deacetylase
MIHTLSLSASGPFRSLLAIGCHADDIEIGCGGTLLGLTRSLPDLHVAWVVVAAPGERAVEARRSAEAFLEDAGSATVEVHEFRDGFLPYSGERVKELFEEMKGRFDPDLVFSHGRADLHQDHRLVCELTWNTFRRHLILEYEIPKYDGDLGTPNVFSPLSEELANEKVRLLETHFPSQHDKHWFDRDTFLGLMRLRGMESLAPERFAEGFVARKVVLSP